MALFRKVRNVRVHYKGREESVDGILTGVANLGGVRHYVLEASVLYIPRPDPGNGEVVIDSHNVSNTLWIQCSDVFSIEVYR